MFSSKYQDLQQTVFGEIVFDDDFCNILKSQNDVTLNKCMSKFRIKSKSRVNWSYDKFDMMIRSSYINCKFELIENFPCNNADDLICKIDKLVNKKNVCKKIYISIKKNTSFN